MAEPGHEVWPDSASLVDEGRLRWDRVLNSRQVTDARLLWLAFAQGGRLVAFDRGLAVGAVPGAAAAHLSTSGTAA